VALGQSTEFACLSDGFEDGYGWEKLVRIGSDEMVTINQLVAGHRAFRCVSGWNRPTEKKGGLCRSGGLSALNSALVMTGDGRLSVYW